MYGLAAARDEYVRLDAFHSTPFGMGNHRFSGHSKSPVAASTIRSFKAPNTTYGGSLILSDLR